jgi:DNA-binding CsgD family transcriptional regulator
MTTLLRLTDREQEVLELMSYGGTNYEIAVELGVGEETIKEHAQRIFRKMNARNRSHAVALGFREGVIS